MGVGFEARAAYPCPTQIWVPPWVSCLPLSSLSLSSVSFSFLILIGSSLDLQNKMKWKTFPMSAWGNRHFQWTALLRTTRRIGSTCMSESFPLPHLVSKTMSTFVIIPPPPPKKKKKIYARHCLGKIFRGVTFLPVGFNQTHFFHRDSVLWNGKSSNNCFFFFFFWWGGGLIRYGFSDKVSLLINWINLYR